MNKKIILASESKRRKTLLKEMGLNYRVVVPKIKEVSNMKRPSSVVKELALVKAKKVADKLQEGIIIAADTIVVSNGNIIGKPKSFNHAKKILKDISSCPHYVYSGIAVIDLYTNNLYIDYDKTCVRMRKIPEEKINIIAGKHMDKAGSYGIQEKEDDLVKSIKGDYYNVVGLPVWKLIKILKKCGVKKISPKFCKRNK